MYLLLCESSTTGYAVQNLELKLAVQFSSFSTSCLLKFTENEIYKMKKGKIRKRDKNRKLLDAGVSGLWMF